MQKRAGTLSGIFFGLLLTGILAGQHPVFAQVSPSRQPHQSEQPGPKDLARLNASQDTLVRLGNNIMTRPFTPERIEAGYTFVNTLLMTFQVPVRFLSHFAYLTNIPLLSVRD